MSSVVEMSVPAGKFALSKTFGTIPDARFEIEKVVASDPDHVMPFVWVTTEEIDLETLNEVLADDPSVENVTELLC